MKKILLILSVLIISLYGNKVNIRTYIPKNAHLYFTDVLIANLELMPNNIVTPYLGSLIEQETCISLTSRGCWNPRTGFRTRREEGEGLGQLTRVFTRNGKVRWDMLKTLKERYPTILKNLNWNNIKYKPKLQIKALILLWHSDFDYYKNSVDPDSRLWFADSAYNGGFKWLNRERRLCKFTKNCNPKKWFGNVALIKSFRAKRKLYGNRSAWDINRQHVRNVRLRYEKYQKLLFEKLLNGDNLNLIYK